MARHRTRECTSKSGALDVEAQTRDKATRVLRPPNALAQESRKAVHARHGEVGLIECAEAAHWWMGVGWAHGYARALPSCTDAAANAHEFS